MLIKKLGGAFFLFVFFYQTAFSIPRSVEIEILSDWLKVKSGRHFYPITIKLKNNSNSKKSGNIKIEHGNFSWAQESIVLQAKERKELTYVISIDGAYDGYNINIDIKMGEVRDHKSIDIDDSYGYSSSGSIDEFNNIMVVSDAMNLGLNAADIRYSVKENLVYRTPMDIPRNQIALSELDFILIPSSTYNSLNHDIKKIIDTYVNWGGNLILLEAGSKRVSNSGLGKIYSKVQSLQKLESLPSDGKMHALSINSLGDSNFDLNVVDSNSTALFVLLLLFVIIIGPINLFILHRIKRKVWAVFTIPVISFSFVFVMVLFAIFSEGFTGNCQYHSFTIINSDDHQAIDISETKIYSPMASSIGVRRNHQSTSFPITKHLGYREMDGRKYQIAYVEGNGQYLRGDYHMSRVNNIFKTLQVLDIKQRIEIKETASGLKLMNGFNDDLNIIVYDKVKDKYYSSSKSWKSGENKLMTLVVQKRKQALDLLELPIKYKKGVISYLKLHGRSNIAYADKSTYRYIYVAIGRQSPFYKSGLSSVNMLESEHVIVGGLK